MSCLLEIKNVTIITIVATILGSIIPMKSHAEEISKPSNEKTINQVSTQSSLTAPDGKGKDFIADPSILYKKAFEINGGLNYSDSSEYYVRITAVYKDGASPISFAANTLIPFYDLNQEDEIFDIVSENQDFAETNR